MQKSSEESLLEGRLKEKNERKSDLLVLF